MLPDSWMPSAAMRRVIVHWTAGTYVVSGLDRKHYHFIIDGDGEVVRGIPPVSANVPPLRDGVYAAHTRGCNSNSIGVSVACMLNATESPFNAGSFPLKEIQFERLADVVAQLCKRYGIPVTRQTVLSHGEVQSTLGIKQAGKWDIARLPFDPNTRGALAVGDKLRAMVQARL